ncbi:MAG: hypothetical protein ACETWM_20190, partial [Candidatus Lokiarchaeia archaeon]
PEILLTITIENHRLIARVTGLEEVGIEICPESETTFFFMEEDGQVTFIKNAQGEVTELVLRAEGQQLTAKKIK